MLKKKKILYQSDFSLAKTGFGRAAKALLKYLYKTNKYDIVHYSCGLQSSNPELKKTPWKSIGALPDSAQEIQELNKDPNIARMASYGAHFLDKIIFEEKPDIYIAVQDIWGIDFAIEKKWFNKITSVLWTTLDSLPILPSAVEKANKIKNYWIWSNFATQALHELGHEHVKTMHGPLESELFYRLPNEDRNTLRQEHNLPKEAFIVGFVFRNQLRKSVPNLLEGYALWKRSNPQIKNTFLLLHTHWGEGWNIHKLAKEYNLDLNEILTTYICKNCNQYEIKPFTGQDLKCKYCNNDKSQVTTNVGLGVTEKQLNEVYNLMDVYCHPFTSGGQEIPIQEAKLTELITLVTNYSCGEELCEAGSGSLPLEWSEYREHGTEFIKASTKPSSIAKQLNKVYNMSIAKRREIGQQSRQWTLDNFSVEVVGKKIEEFLDNSPYTNFDFSNKEEERNPYAIIPEIKDDSEWLTYMYHNILKMHHLDANDEGHKYWIQELKNGIKREAIENYFRQVANKENQENKKTSFEEILDSEGVENRILYVMPESIGDIYLSTSLFESIKKQYPDKNLYVATKPEYFDILKGNSYIHKVIPYISQMDQLLWLEGAGDHNGFFEIAFLPHIGTQRVFNYQHNGKDKIAFDLKDE
jgi:glycosyltransferase involved in cell wall biosynthesis